MSDKQDLPAIIARVRDDAWGSACSQRGPVETAKLLATALEEQMAEVERLREALQYVSLQDCEESMPLEEYSAETLAEALRHSGRAARSALEGNR